MKKIILLSIICSSCMIQRAHKVQTPEMANALESYYETVWNAENNLPGEHRFMRRAVRQELQQNRYDYGTPSQLSEGSLYEQTSDSTWIKVK